MNGCEQCLYGEWDEAWGETTCNALWDEDVAARMREGQYAQCPYFRPGDDYAIVRRQN